MDAVEADMVGVETFGRESSRRPSKVRDNVLQGLYADVAKFGEVV